MRLVKPSYEVVSVTSDALEILEVAGRTCYKSEDRIAEGTAVPFVRRIVQQYKHESVIEHASVTVKFIVDRGVSHELVRHRICSFSQESTRYCNYGKAGHVTFVIPPWLDLQPGEYLVETAGDRPVDLWTRHLIDSERRYLDLLKAGWSPQQARSVLPNSLKTEIVVTANFREWRHILKLRTAKAAHPQMREIMKPLLADLKIIVPVIFDDIIEEAAE